MPPAIIQTQKLSATQLFKGLPNSALDRILAHAHPRTLVKKEVIFHQDDDATQTWFILKGRLKLIQVNELGEEIILHYVGQYELAAAVSCISSLQYPASAEVIQPGEAISWSRTDLKELMLKYPQLALNTFDIVQSRFGDLQKRYMDLNTRRVELRLARTLLRLLDRGGRKVKNGVLIDFPLTRQDLAEHAGTTLFSASRILSEWEKRSLIHSEHKRIVVTDLHGLVVLAEDLS